MSALRQSTPGEPPLQASKWLQSQALIDGDEMSSLFDALGDFSLYSCGTVCDRDQGEIAKEKFLIDYRAYIDTLRQGISPDPTFTRSLFSPAMTTTTDVLFAIPVGENKQIIRVSKPVVQLQAHNMDYSTVDKKFHSMVFGVDSISWGIQYSYPQLYQDNKTKKVETIKDTPMFPNTHLFHVLQKWMRQHTIPTPFLAEGVSINVPMRLGKKCLSWINVHPHLIKKGITVRC